MFRILKYLLLLAVLGLLALTVYAFLGDLSPDRQPVEIPITLTPQ